MARMSITLALVKNELTLFDDSPDTGWPACICSYCGNVIGADEAPWRVLTEDGKQEARLCAHCNAIQVIEMGQLLMNKYFY